MVDSTMAPLVGVLRRLFDEGVAPELKVLVEGALPDGDAHLWFTRAPRLLGKAQVVLSSDERSRFSWPMPSLAADELVRILLLVRAAEALPEPAFQALLDGVYRHGENRERVAALRALPFLPAPERFVALAQDACRTNVVPVFEAIACENPYPAQHFSPDSFRQLVIKAIFLELSIQRIHGLRARVDAELSRMASDYAAERRAAGRVVPEDAAWLSTRSPTP